MTPIGVRGAKEPETSPGKKKKRNRKRKSRDFRTESKASDDENKHDGDTYCCVICFNYFLIGGSLSFSGVKHMKREFEYVTAIHGNEPMPTLALASLGVTQIVGNPRALSRNERYVGCDLNAAFGITGPLYEHGRASYLLRRLDKDSFVIDFHTMSCTSLPFVIVVDPAMLRLAASVGLEHVVYMKHNIKAGHALINHHKGISIEIGGHESADAFERTQSVYQRLIRDGVKQNNIRVYEVFGRIEGSGTYENFVASDEGFVPILYGEKAYITQGFFGLKAMEIAGIGS